MECADILIAAGRRRSPSPSPSGWHPARQWRKAFNIIRACRWLARGVRILSAGALTRSASYVAINIHRESHSDADAAELFAAAAVDESFRGLVKEKRKDCFLRLGGGAGIMARLFSGKERGILGDADDVRRRKEAFGQNSYPKPKLKSFFVCFWDALKDVFLLSLLVCSAISVGFGIKKHGLKDGWYDGVSIFVAVFILTGVSAAGSHSQAKRYDKLASESADIAVTVVRAARRQEVSVFHVVVGDVVILKIGDAVPADGVFLEGHGLLVDDSTLTGEFHPHRVEIDAEKNPFLTAGVKVVDGYARMLVTAVGTDTSWGELLSIHASLNTDPAPLQKRLESLISTIGKVCVAVAVVHFTDSGKLPLLDKGVPLAVTLVVSFSMKRMVKDNALVNHLSAFQKLASVTVICADKTGTLTTKQMKVTEFWVGTDQPREATAIAGGVLRLLRQGAGLNTTGSVYRQGNVSPLEISGSPTEKALLSWAVADLCTDTNELKSSYEVIHVEAFNSRQKHSRVIARDNANGVVTAHWKGAAEVVLAKCSMYMDTEGAAGKVGVEQRKELEKVINDMSAGGLRCIAFAYKQVDGTGQSKMDDDEGLTLLGMVGIKDPCRPEVEATIDTCRKAGIAVKMVTGGNIVTARAMAIECGIISGNDPYDVVVEGCVFRNMSVVRQLEMADNMRVMVASRPLDKLLLVSRLQQKGHVVAVTGDRTNDAAALRKADVVLSMGAQGTDVDKDTIILSNKFDTVVTAASSGRCIYSNIQKFIQFNLTVNFVLASTRGIISLTTLQILWVNLMMPTMGALALVTEKPTDALMDSPPIPRMAPLISNAMWRNMAAQAAFQIAVLLALQYLGRDFLGTDDKSNGTMIFNVFVLCQAFNEFNSRDIVKRNIFAGVLNNKMFLVVVAATLVLQVVMVEVLTRVAGTERLGLRLWGICVGIAAVSWPLGWAVKCIPVPVEHAVNATHVAGDDGRRAGALELAEVHPSDAQDEPWHTSSPGSSIV